MHLGGRGSDRAGISPGSHGGSPSRNHASPFRERLNLAHADAFSAVSIHNPPPHRPDRDLRRVFRTASHAFRIRGRVRRVRPSRFPDRAGSPKPGIIAGALSASIIAALLVAGLFLLTGASSVFLVCRRHQSAPRPCVHLRAFRIIFGLLVSGALYVVVEVTRICLHAKQRVKSSEEMEIRWLPPDDDPSEVR